MKASSLILTICNYFVLPSARIYLFSKTLSNVFICLNTSLRAWSTVQLIECLTDMHEAFGTIWHMKSGVLAQLEPYT